MRQGYGFGELRAILEKLPADALRCLAVPKQVAPGIAFRDFVLEPNPAGSRCLFFRVSVVLLLCFLVSGSGNLLAYFHPSGGFYATEVSIAKDHRANHMYSGSGCNLAAGPGEDVDRYEELLRDYIEKVWFGAPGAFVYIMMSLLAVSCGEAPGRWLFMLGPSDLAKSNFCMWVVFIFTGRTASKNFQAEWFASDSALRMEYQQYVGNEIATRCPEATCSSVKGSVVKNLPEPEYTAMTRVCHGAECTAVRTGFQARFIEQNPDALQTFTLEKVDDFPAIYKRCACIHKKKNMGRFVDAEKALEEFGGVEHLPPGVFLKDESFKKLIFDVKFARAFWRLFTNFFREMKVGDVMAQISSLRGFDAKYSTTLHEDTEQLVRNMMPAGDGPPIAGPGIPGAAAGGNFQQSAPAAADPFQHPLAGKLTTKMTPKQKAAAETEAQAGRAILRAPTHNGRVDHGRSNVGGRWFWPKYKEPGLPAAWGKTGHRRDEYLPNAAALRYHLKHGQDRRPNAVATMLEKIDGANGERVPVEYKYCAGVPPEYGSRRYALSHANTPQGITREARGAAFGGYVFPSFWFRFRFLLGTILLASCGRRIACALAFPSM